MRQLLFAAATAAAMLATASIDAQHWSEFTARDKTELFIQHIVKVMRLEPSKYQAMVLEYEIGAALQEISAVEPGDLGGNFIRGALAEIYPAFGRLRESVEGSSAAELDEEMQKALRECLGHGDPYLAAHASLLRAEIDFRAGEYDKVVERCERIIASERLRLIHDHRACELVALCFEKQEKPLLALAQYAILLVDYRDLPADVEQRAKSRLSALGSEVGRPLQAVAGWMNQVEKYLSQELTAEDPTQEQERTIVTALDKLIELQEAKERNACPG
ncbi:MAG: hypothetical protein JXA90_09435 [Planctomycetes bacterium]|nr:hypothetical protein [Planctomycetota bacterium]